MRLAAGQSAKAAAMAAFERISMPDVLTRVAIEALVNRTRLSLAEDGAAPTRDFVSTMAQGPIAAHVAAANAQHYEVPADFFGLLLGGHRKYSCCLYEREGASLDQAELRALEVTTEHAALRDGQQILELGCGWGSLSLFMAERFPGSSVLAVSNSQSQREYIEREADRRQLANLRVVTADINDFQPGAAFDRVVSVEMFEHVGNWGALLSRVRSWLAPGGLLFVHVFSHARVPYRFDHADQADWIAKHFFTGGIMPSHALIREFGDLFEVTEEWRWNGHHYRRTADDWLANFDRNRAAILRVFEPVYGDDTKLWMRRWRLFLLATSGLFGHRGGDEWGVSHYLPRPALVR